MSSDPDNAPHQRASWTFLSNHAHVLICLDRDPDLTMRHVAEQVGITLRAVQGIVADLIHAGYLSSTREGRRNTYVVHHDQPLRHPLEAHTAIGALLDAATPRSM